MLKSRYIYIFIAFATFGIVGSAFYQDSVVENMRAERIAENERQSRVETADSRGFENVVSARDGGSESIVGFIDVKFLCHDVSVDQRETCTTAVAGSDGHMLIRLKICSEMLRENCLVYDTDPEVSNDLRNVHLFDNKGRLLDFDGAKVISEPNGLASCPVPVKFTGKVNVVNGQGRFIEPIERIDSVE